METVSEVYIEDACCGAPQSPCPLTAETEKLTSAAASF